MTLALVHLVRAANGFEPFSAFMDSYERHEPGVEHDLVLILKGFDAAPVLRERIRERAQGKVEGEVALADDGMDLWAYARAAERLGHSRVCLVNSFSRVLAPRWLALLDEAVGGAAVGAAGATASWGSHLSWCLYQLGGSGPYADAFPGRSVSQEALRELDGGAVVTAPRYWAYAAWTALRQSRGARFPSPHLRTNGLICGREDFLSVCAGALRTKSQSYRVESGPASLTTRLRTAGRDPVVVDRTGCRFGVHEWPEADVFCQAEQSTLLLADNQTVRYAEADSLQRQVLSAFAWGPRARPG